MAEESLGNPCIMQGRLCAKPGAPLQSFPESAWQDEFNRAATLGFAGIEWLLDGINDAENPIGDKKGRNLILEMSSRYGVSVTSICAHAFIDGSLLERGARGERSRDKLWRVIDWAWATQIEMVILPLMDKMSLKEHPALEIFFNIFKDKLSGSGPVLLLESDLPAIELKNLIESIGKSRLGVLYDLGNANALGFNLENDLTLLHSLIYEIHIKDRLSFGGSSVRLGEGDTPFADAAQTLAKLRWNGQVVLETPTFDNWQIEAEHNLRFTREWLNSIKVTRESLV